MALWSKLGQCLVWEQLVTKLTDIHPGEPDAQLSDAALSSRRAPLGYRGLQTLMQRRCVVLADPLQMPSAFFGDYRLMAIGASFRRPLTRIALQAALSKLFREPPYTWAYFDKKRG